MSLVGYLAVILVCLFLSAFFSSSETALLRLNPDQIDKDLKQKSVPSLAVVRDLIKSSSRLLVTILVGNNVVNILAAACASSVAVYLLGEQLGLLASTIVMTILVLLFAEILPKAIAAKNPQKISNFVSVPLYLFHKILFPVHVIFDRFIDPIINRIAGQSNEGLHSSESILRLARQVRHRKHEGNPLPIIGSAAKAAELTATDIMIPRAEVFAFSVDTPAQELLDKVLDERFTRIPIYEENLDKILGVIHSKQLTKLVRSGQTNLRAILKPVIRVPERMPILSLLADMQRAFIHMAIVKDEFGVTMGIITQEDILEEIVGEIRDEFDKEELMSIQKVNDSEFDVFGRVLVRDVNRETGWDLPAERGDTVGGFIYNSLGKAPKVGDTISANEYQLVVRDMSGGRVIRVRISKAASVPDQNEANQP